MRVPPDEVLIEPPGESDGPPKKTVVLDMDETLLHSVFASRRRRGNWAAEAEARRVRDEIFIDWPDGYSLQVYLRPGLDEFLKFVAAHFECILWTAGTKPYAEEILKVLDPHAKLFSHVIYRDRRWFKMARDGRGYVKDLSALGRSLKHTMLIENNALVCRFNWPNAIIVSDWVQSAFDTKDDALSRVTTVLKSWLTDFEDAEVPSLLDGRTDLYHTHVNDTVCHTTFPLQVKRREGSSKL
eukprot:TRINITY_DN2940_c0_g1_i1.p1 TRINITY_DN2940_c0_g1~~TRINITY_DN2940_c0_g1_i1.p1  ORF type:complete len:241 (+),score=59.56 TRINITY_DN2940_c0_g1_i1:67-789(+)